MLLRDVRVSLRTLRRNPSFALAALAVVALGIGATTAVFTVVRAVLLQPLPYREPDRLVVFRSDAPGFAHVPAITTQEFLALRDRTDIFEGIGTINDSHANLTGVEDMEAVSAASISDNFLPLLGVAPAMGRQVSSREDVGPRWVRAVNISYELWQRRWRGDPGLVGRHIEVNNLDLVVAGVMPRGFRTYLGAGTDVASRIDIWFPGAPDAGPDSRSVPAIARLAPGVTIAAAQRAVDAFMDPFIAAHAAGYRTGRARLSLVGLGDDVVHAVLPALLALAGAVAFVLLVACANLTNLLLARACARTRELAVRTAVGASRGQLVAQLATESVVLACLGAAAGLVVAHWGIAALLHFAPPTLPRRESIGVDGVVAGFAAGMSLLCSLAFGLIPAWHATRTDVSGRLKHDPSATRGAGITRGVLVASQLALSLVLLVAAGLMARAFVSLHQVSLGFDPARVLRMRVDINRHRFDTPEKRWAFYTAVAAAVRQLPGIEEVGAGFPVPFDDVRVTQRFAVSADVPERSAAAFVAMPGYLEALRVPLLAGRYFTAADNGRPAPRVIVDQRLADLAWPGANAVGQRLLLGARTAARQWAEVVGVVAPVRTQDLRNEPTPQIWVTYVTKPYFESGLIVRAQSHPAALAAAVKRAVERLGGGRPVSDIRLLEDDVADATAETRFALFVLGTFALVAVVLTAVGVYGVVAYATARRTREIAVRLALGGGAPRVVALVLRESAASTAAGLIAGALMARGLTRYLESLLFRVGPNDLTTFGVVALVLGAVALGATTLPAMRAVRVDPMIALRSE